MIIKSVIMGEIDGEWLFAVWMWIVAIMLIAQGIRYHRARRHLPKNPMDKRANRRIALDNLKFFLGMKGKDGGDNPMKQHAGDNDTFFR